MKIRAKRTILLLCFAILPVTLLFILHADSMRKTNRHLTDETRQLLEANAKQHLQAVVSDFGRIVQRDRVSTEQSLTIMGNQIEEKLSDNPPKTVKPYFSKDYENIKTAPADLTPLEHYSKIVNGKQQDIPVSLSNVVFFLTAGTRLDSVIGDINKLGSMGKICRGIRISHPGGMTWLYAGFEKGFFMSYPGHGGYPENYDPRKRNWYQRARREGTIGWTLLPDVSTRKVVITLSKPIHYPDGKFAGVAAIDTELTQMLDIVNLPEAWKASAVILQVDPEARDPDTSNKENSKAKPAEHLLIIAQESYASKGGEDWEKPIEWEYLTSPDKKQLNAMKADILAGRPGIRRMRLKDSDTIWAYGKWQHNQPLGVVVVPYNRVVAQAESTEKFMGDEFRGVAAMFSILLTAVLVAAFVAAMISARAGTKPISQLAVAAGELSEGNFEAQVDIRTGDELQDLGKIFNTMGPKLLAEQTMRRSLEIAREIQQRLLPQSNPKVDGFDIAGASIYCDETGGDYYDFIDLSEKKSGVLGVALGDITGHGIQAALLMAAARGVLRSHAADYFDKLDKLMEDINEHLVADTDPAHFLTLFYAILDPEDRTIKCVSAGHDPALWLCKDSAEFCELGKASGIMLGVLEGITYDDSQPVKLSGGDVILIGTDGIWEARNPDRQLFEKDRLQEIIRANAHKSAVEIIDTVNDAVTEYRDGAPQEDDITMIVIKVL